MKRYVLENSSFAGNWKTRREKLCMLLRQREMKSLERGRLNDARNGQKNGRRERTSSIRRHGIFTLVFTAKYRFRCSGTCINDWRQSDTHRDLMPHISMRTSNRK